MTSIHSTSGFYPTVADAQLPYSHIIVLKEPVPVGLLQVIEATIRALCRRYPHAPTGEVLAGITMIYKDLIHGFAGEFHPAVVDELEKDAVSCFKTECHSSSYA